MSLLSPSRSAKTSPSVGFKKIAKDRACWFDFRLSGDGPYLRSSASRAAAQPALWSLKNLQGLRRQSHTLRTIASHPLDMIGAPGSDKPPLFG
jgi:hypothetical protein